MAVLSAAAAGGGGGAAAQVDTTPPDTIPRLLPVFPAPVPPGPLPGGSRYRFDADSLVFSNVYTLSDLLAHVPGVYVARGGYYGQAEAVLYGGRGPLGLEVYWDGMRYLPIGRDSVYLDPARIPLAPLERVEVVVLPAVLRVYLMTSRPRSTDPATAVRIATGELGLAGYRGGFARRWRSGLGLSLEADWNTLDGSAESSSSSFAGVDLWLKAEYVPSGRVGASYQILSSTWKRGGGDAAGLVDPWRYKRRDGIFRVFLAARADGLGYRFEAALASATAERDTAVARRSTYQNVLVASYTWRRAHLALSARLADRRQPFELEARGGWVPVTGLTLAADVRRTGYAGSRHGERVHVSAGLELPAGLSALGELAWARDLQAPTLPADTVQATTDLSGALRWERGWLTLEVGGGRRDAFAPVDFPSGVKPVAALGPTSRTTFARAHASLRPVAGVQLAGWYFDPIRGGGDFEPPHHARLSAAFYSKFWRVFRSGIFALRGEAALESWSSSNLGGRDDLGGQYPLPGASFVETNIEMQIGDVTIFWIIRNNNGMRSGYVPGLGYPKVIQYYGAHWRFRN